MSNSSQSAKQLMSGLLERDPSKRLGCGENGAEGIRQHHFFFGVDWEALHVGCYADGDVPAAERLRVRGADGALVPERKVTAVDRRRTRLTSPARSIARVKWSQKSVCSAAATVASFGSAWCDRWMCPPPSQ